MKTITNIITLLSLLLTIGCTNTSTSTEEMSTQDKIAFIDSIICQNSNYQISIESVDLYGMFGASFSAERIITDKDSICFFIFRSKEKNSHAIILPTEVDNLCSKLDSVNSIVSTPINYKKSFTISNNGGLSVTAITDENNEWDIYIDLLLQNSDRNYISKEYLQYLITTLKACIDKKGHMKSSEQLTKEELFYSNIERDFFLKIDLNDSIKRTKSGIRYKILKDKQGARPNKSNKVKIKYKAINSISGEILDSSTGFFNMDGIIWGLQEGIQLMTAGSKYILYVPSNLAYGESGNRYVNIQPFTPIIYEVELLYFE